jgi:hypothetical protein
VKRLLAVIAIDAHRSGQAGGLLALGFNQRTIP